MAETIAVQSIALDADGSVQISYCRPDVDVKEIGVLHMHTLLVPSGGEYDDEIQAVLDSVEALVREVLDDLPAMEARSER